MTNNQIKNKADEYYADETADKMSKDSLRFI
jgi:hypothetical protein